MGLGIFVVGGIGFHIEEQPHDWKDEADLFVEVHECFERFYSGRGTAFTTRWPENIGIRRTAIYLGLSEQRVEDLLTR